MRDADVRQVLRERLQVRYGGDLGTVVVEELGVCRGTVRVDLAVVNGSLKGYEIKSAEDTLARLPIQSEIYSRVFDTMTLVVADRHLRAAEALVPPWWGIEVAASESGATVQVTAVRAEVPNPAVEPLALVQLLWRKEVSALLVARNLPFPRNKSRRVLWESLVAAVSLPELKDMVRTCLKSRSQWLADGLQRRYDATFPPSAMSSDSLYRLVLPRSRRYTHRPN